MSPAKAASIFLKYSLLFFLATPVVSAETIRIGLAMPETMQEIDYLNGMYLLFREEVESRSKGKLKVQMYFGGVLGKPDERLNQVRRNIIQMSDASDGNYATIFRDIQVLSMPYLFPSREIAQQLLDGAFGTKLAESLRKKTGIRVLGWWESAGFKHYSSNNAIMRPGDLKGQKMRVMSAAFSVPVIAMGGTATPVPMPELYISLKTGVVDGQDNAVSVFNMLKLYEVQKHLTLDAHIYSFGPLAINDEFFQGLSKDKQKIVIEAGKRAVAWNRKRSLEREQEAVEIARSKGVNLIRLSNETREAFKRLAQPAAIKWLKENIDTPALVEQSLQEVRALQIK